MDEGISPNPFYQIWRDFMDRRNTLALAALVNKRVRFLVDHALGSGRFVVRNIRCQLPNEKFLKQIDGGRFANPD